MTNALHLKDKPTVPFKMLTAEALVTERVDLVNRNFQKACDEVPHNRLVANIEAHGIKGTVQAAWNVPEQVPVTGAFYSKVIAVLISPAPKLVFNRVNGKRCPTSGITDTWEEEHTPAHEENVRFVYEAWQQVEEALGANQQLENGQCAQGPVKYVEKTPNQNLKNFVPIDLEEWWAKQFLANIQNTS
ncbi:MAPK regulated corepressor interacting protein 2-like [Scyliorhinus canicula]|uniref:MAPK regulated corepressor interacting protein 2-like n=1 Tax=Scyliorhinus canicula TaxID=7830 RepID=UPI0018F4A138|nr:MAPK regulated corepressor interacting protein 2-like [Scyliorhinus canicula]